MFTVYFARGYFNEEIVATCRTEEAAVARADEEFANGSRDIEVYDSAGVCIYVADEEVLFDEY